MSTDRTRTTSGYVHGFTEEERARLRGQARIVEHRIHDRLPFHRCKRLLEVGCGVGAQTEILLRRFPDLHVTGVDASESNLAAAREFLDTQPCAQGRFDLQLQDATRLDLPIDTFDSAFLCWILEHVADPALVLSEVRRVLRHGSPVVVNEVQNASFFLAPYSPHTLAYWTAFNDHQFELGGDPFVGAKLGNLLQRVGFRDIVTEVRTVHLDNREPGERAEFLDYWTDLLLSGAAGLLAAERVSAETVEEMKGELANVGRDPDAVFFYSFVQAHARVD
ncbi:MAG: methyltransferase domain-containing protein [bacterium]|nr:methyltransferase domain-containing protein [bacterium]